MEVTWSCVVGRSYRNRGQVLLRTCVLRAYSCSGATAQARRLPAQNSNFKREQNACINNQMEGNSNSGCHLSRACTPIRRSSTASLHSTCLRASTSAFSASPCAHITGTSMARCKHMRSHTEVSLPAERGCPARQPTTAAWKAPPSAWVPLVNRVAHTLVQLTQAYALGPGHTQHTHSEPQPSKPHVPHVAGIANIMSTQ